MIRATINNIEVEVKEGTTILEAAKKQALQYLPFVIILI